MPSTRTVESPAARTSGSSTEAGVGRRDVGVGPAHERARVDPAQHVEQRPGGRQHVVERAEDRRALHRLAQVARLVAARVQRDRAEAPGEQQGQRGEQERAADPVERRRPRSARSARRRRRLTPSSATARKAPSRTPASTATSGA